MRHILRACTIRDCAGCEDAAEDRKYDGRDEDPTGQLADQAADRYEAWLDSRW